MRNISARQRSHSVASEAEAERAGVAAAGCPTGALGRDAGGFDDGLLGMRELYEDRPVQWPNVTSRDATDRPDETPAEALAAAVADPVGTFLGGCRRAFSAARAGLVLFYNSNNLTFASSIAYYTLLSIFPFLLIVLAIIGSLAVSDGAVGPNLLNLVATAVPSRFDFLVGQLEQLAAAPLQLGIAGTLLTLWASMGVFGAITSAVNHAWGVERNYSFWKHKLVAFAMMFAAAALAIIAVALISTVQVVEARWFAGILASHPGLSQFSGELIRSIPTALFIVVVGLIYYFIPNTRVRLRGVWFGAILAGVLWRLAFEGFAWYVKDLSRFTVHGSVGAVVAFLVWVYVSAVILLYGVEVTVAWTKGRSS
jgi:membrane protein